MVLGEVSNSKLAQEYLSRILPAPPPAHLMMGSTGIGFDPAMLRHECACGDHSLHPENPRRLQSIWSHLVGNNLNTIILLATIKAPVFYCLMKKFKYHENFFVEIYVI